MEKNSQGLTTLSPGDVKMDNSQSSREAYIRFMAPIIPQTCDQLFKIIDKKITAKCSKINLMISSPGGSVFHGLSIYNFIKGAPIEIDTFNFGSVDSIGVVVYCAGTKRFSVPHARFLIHGVRFNIRGNANFDEKELDEHFKSLKIDQQNIAKVIADTCGKKTTDVLSDMNERTTLDPTQAKKYGLVHEIKSGLFPIDADLSVIGELQPQQQVPFSFPIPPAQAYTKTDIIEYNL